MGAAPHPAIAEKRLPGTLRLERHSNPHGWTYDVSFFGDVQTSGKLPILRLHSSDELVNLLDRLGVDFDLQVVRITLLDLLRDGYGTIPEIQLSEKQLREAGLI